VTDTRDSQPASGRSAAGGDTSVSLLFFRELIVDLISILIPGFGFVAVSVPAFLLPLFWFLTLLDGTDKPNFTESFGKLSQSISVFHAEIFISVIVVSYTVGHLMFRQDPRRPDQFSWISAHADLCKPRWLSLRLRWLLRTLGSDTKFSIPDDMRSSSKFNGMVRPLEEHKELAKVPVEFPYSHLAKYLKERDLAQLATNVSWDGSEKESQGRRSKTFINTIKAALEFKYPEKIRELVRIESHIRLHSSLWFACYYAAYLSIGGIGLGAASNVILWHRHTSLVLGLVVLPTLTYLVAYFVQSLIEKSFHYQRAREIVYVLKFDELVRDMEKAANTRPTAAPTAPHA
jgi:hypothetical protein